MIKILQTLFFFLLVTQICFAQWVQTSLDSGNAQCFEVMDTILFVGTGNGIVRSTNGGTSWDYIVLPDSFYFRDIHSLAVSGTNLLAGTCQRYSRMYLSTDTGANWTYIGEGRNIVVDESIILVASWSCADMGCGGQIIVSTDSGINWTATDFTFGQGGPPASLAISSGNLFVGLSEYWPHSGVFRSTNEGASWSQVNSGLADTNVVSLFVYGTSIFAATLDGGVYRSTDNGTSWSQSGLAGILVTSFSRHDMNLFAGTTNSGIFLSTNSGASWTAVNEGLTDTTIVALVVHGEYLFAGTEGEGVWRRPLYQMITSVEPVSNELPNEFLLHQNYPNPFNPSTVISYQLPVIGEITLKVYGILGNEIATLVNEFKPAGKYVVEFNAVDLPSGVYFYRIQAGEFIQTKKMILLK